MKKTFIVFLLLCGFTICSYSQMVGTGISQNNNISNTSSKKNYLGIESSFNLTDDYYPSQRFNLINHTQYKYFKLGIGLGLGLYDYDYAVNFNIDLKFNLLQDKILVPFIATQLGAISYIDEIINTDYFFYPAFGININIHKNHMIELRAGRNIYTDIHQHFNDFNGAEFGISYLFRYN
ncbi:MAG: hypothetical protein WC984_03760 [Bacteroidales bacterium]